HAGPFVKRDLPRTQRSGEAPAPRSAVDPRGPTAPVGDDDLDRRPTQPMRDPSTVRIAIGGAGAAVAADLPETARATPSPVSLVVPPRVLDDDAPRYEPRARLGRGGMGQVQLCLDRRIG